MAAESEMDPTIRKSMDQNFAQASNQALTASSRLGVQINDGSQFGFETVRALNFQTIMGSSLPNKTLDYRSVRDQPGVSPMYAFMPSPPYTGDAAQAITPK